MCFPTFEYALPCFTYDFPIRASTYNEYSYSFFSCVSYDCPSEASI